MPHTHATVLATMLALGTVPALPACATTEVLQEREPLELSADQVETYRAAAWSRLTEAQRASLPDGPASAQLEIVYLDEQGEEHAEDAYPKAVITKLRVRFEGDGEPVEILLDPTAAQPHDPPPPTTRYTVGDYVVYEYTGSALEAPVRLEEQVLAVEGLRLTIRVEATRAGERRAWKQVVTDTPHNRNNNVVDELYEIVDGQERALDATNQAELYRLYAWVVPPMQGEPTDVSKLTREVDVAGTPLQANCSTGQVTVAEQPARFTFCDAEAFLWTHAWTEITHAETGDLLFGMEVTDSGQR